MQTPETTAARHAPAKRPAGTCWRCTQPATCSGNGFCSIERRNLAPQAPANGITHTRAILARGNHLAAQNDEPEPTFRDIEARANADARAIVRGLQP